jgi:hypothetical protein
MRIEIIKTRNGFQIPRLESMAISDRLFATVEISPPVRRQGASHKKKKTGPLIQKAIRQLGGDDLLEGILNRLPKDYQYIPDNMSDEDVLYEALKEKYDL